MFDLPGKRLIGRKPDREYLEDSAVAHVTRYPDPDSNGQFQGGPRLNRFRRIVESSVQANRLVVESAQKEDEKLEADTQHHTSAELDVWKSGSSDTATWLYHLVFSPDAASPSSPSPQPRQLHQASVADESAETNTKTGFLLSSEAPIPPKRRPSEPEDKALILWSKQTEPGLVADRLLSSWTTLSSSQIGLSSTRHHGIEGAEDDEWREGILNMAEEEAEKDDNSSFGEWEQENDPIGSDDEAFQSAEEASTIGTSAPPYNFRSNTQKARTRSAKTADRSDSWAYTYGSSPVYGKPPEPSRVTGEPHVSFGTSSTSRPHRNRSKQRRPTISTTRPPFLEADSRKSSSRVHTIHSDSMDSAHSAPSRDYFDSEHYRERARSEFSNPFTPGHIPPSISYGHTPPPWQGSSHVRPPPEYHQEPPRQAYASDSHLPYPRSPPSPQQVAAPLPPSPVRAPPIPTLHMSAPTMPAPLVPDLPVEMQPKTSENEAREDALLARVETLLQKRSQEPRVEYEDPPFSRLAKVLQEREVQSERERANAATEARMNQMQVVHEKNEEKVKQLESLVAAQRAEQRRMEVIWEEERKAIEAKATKQAQELREQAAKEIAAAQMAKETAQAALNVEKLETEKEARKRADAIFKAERERTEDFHKLQLHRYEELLHGLREQLLNSEHESDRAIRRTQIAEGNRTVDVTEYATSKRAPLSISASSSFIDNFAHLDMRPGQTSYHDRPQRSSRRHSFRSTTASLHASRASLGSIGTPDSTSKSQQVIIFPAKADRRSERMHKLQKSLTRFGIESDFEDPEDLHQLHTSQLVQYDYDNTNDQTVRSTIFWEASALNLGSELLLTMRQAGWRPSYTRISGRDPSLKSIIIILTLPRERPNSLFRKSTGAYLLLRPGL